MNMSLGQLIDLNGNKTNQDKYTAEKRYVKSSIPKGWDGNLILFATSKDQYSKRFKKNSCCGTVKATQYHKNCFPDDIIKNEEGEFINNMIPWESGSDSISVCQECGYIEETASSVEEINEKNKDQKLTKKQQEVFIKDPDALTKAEEKAFFPERFSSETMKEVSEKEIKDAEEIREALDL